jgi:triphosphatase
MVSEPLSDGFLPNFLTQATVARFDYVGPRMSEPFHLSFDIAPSDLGKLRRHAELRLLTVGRAATRLLDEIFFDDASFSLRDQPLVIETLRLRRAGLMLPTGEVGSLADCPDPEILMMLDGRDPAALRPVFSRRVSCVERHLALDGANAICVMEVGELSNLAGSVPIARLHFSQAEGQPFRLFGLVREIRKSIALRLVTTEQAELGYLRLTEAGHRLIRSGRLELAPQMSREAALAAILRSCLVHWLANEPVVTQGRRPDGVHQMRVALRRLRAALSLFRGLMPVAREGWVKAEVKWLAQLLGGGREWDVFLGATLPPVEAEFESEPGLTTLRRTAEALREDAYEAIEAAIESERYTVLLLELYAWVAELQQAPAVAAPGEDIAAFATDKGRKRTAKILRAGRDLNQVTVERRHEIRLELKKLRYTGEFFLSLLPSRRVGRTLALVADLQELLGEGNDIATARGLLARLAAHEESAHTALAQGLILGWHAGSSHDRSRRLDRQWRDFAETKSVWR